jgi:hypothetical protein
MRDENMQNKESIHDTEIKNKESEKKNVELQNNNVTEESKHSTSSIFAIKKRTLLMIIKK